MHTFEIQDSIKSLFAEMESYQPFIAALSALARAAVDMESYLPGLATGGGSLASSANQIHNHLANARQTTALINTRKFFKALENFQVAISRIRSLDVKNDNLISDLNTGIEELASLYNEFLSNQTGENALPLFLAAKILHTKVATIFHTLQWFEESTGAYDIPNSSEAPLALLLSGHLDLVSFAHRLLAIQNIYSELCMLFSVSESTHPLRISKIESGSLWVKIFGESRIVEMMTKFLEQTASWIFRSYTSEGKIASVPRKVEAIESLLKLTERLTEAGVDTSDMKAHIGKSAVAIAKGLSDILDGQSSVVINEKNISVGSEISKGLLTGSGPQQLLGPVPTNIDESLTLPRLK